MRDPAINWFTVCVLEGGHSCANPQCHAVIRLYGKETESEVERGSTNQYHLFLLVIVALKWLWGIMWCLHRAPVTCQANSCYANQAEDNVWKLISSPLKVNVNAEQHLKPSCLFVFIYRVFFIEKFNFSPAEARAVNR